MPVEMVVVIIVLFIIYGLGVYRWFLKDLPPFAVRLVSALIVVHIVLLGIYVYTRLYDVELFWRWYFNYKYGEYNPTATFSTVQYTLTGLTALVIAWLGEPRKFWHRLYWLGLGGCFFFLALDEYFIIHEKWGNRWIVLYGAVGLAFAFMTIFVYRRFPRDWRTYVMLLGGLGVATVGAVGLEVLSANACFGLIYRVLCGELPILEEFFENMGVLTILIGLMLYANKHIAATRWSRVSRVVGVGGLVGCAMFLAGLWVVPTFELKTIAQPVEIAYTTPDLSITGYRLANHTLHPGNTFDLSIYWQKTGSVSGGGRFGLSAHVVERVSGTDITSTNKLITNPQAVQARQNMPFRSTLTLQLPEDIPTPASYWITLAMWQEQGEDYALQTVHTTDRPLLAPDASILLSITVLDPNPAITIPETGGYQFLDNFSLSGYEYQQNDQGLDLQFAWEKYRDSQLDQDYVQFFHLLDADGQFMLGLDQPPFAGSFPTTDWPNGLYAQTSWHVPLPEDLPPGDYTLYTGLYNPVTSERLPVTTASGDPIPNNYINLGSLTIQP